MRIKIPITVHFMANQGAEDLFYDEENKTVYLRQPCTDKRYVVWLTCTKWTGGYEADAPLARGTQIRIVNNPRKCEEKKILCTELMSCGYAKKEAPFSYEDIKAITAGYRQSMDLKDHSEWKSWLIAKKPEAEKSTLDDNWLYCSDNVLLVKDTPIDDFYGRHLMLEEAMRKHRLSGAEWDDVKIVTSDEIILELVGYRFDEVRAGVLNG